MKIFGKRVFTVYKHYVYRLNYSESNLVPVNRLEAFEVTDETFSMIHGSKALYKMITEQKDRVQGFGFKNEAGNVIGHLFIMYKGGVEVMYKIQNIDAYLFAVRIYSEYQGNGYAPEMISWIIKELHEKGFDTIYLTVQKKNKRAIKIYEKLNFKVIDQRSFIRILKLNIPYYTL